MATAWTLAQSLVQLRNQLNTAYPFRSKVSDGTIGDAAHALTPSEHNPDRNGVVRAIDITHDPKNGLDIQTLADSLVASRDSRILYIICNSRIVSPDRNWQWQAYSGSNPHSSHIHISVNHNHDNTNNWQLPGKEQQTEMIKDLNHLDALFVAFRGRKSIPSEQKLYINTVSYDQMVETLNLGEERDNIYHATNVGKVAVQDNWQQQIYDGQARELVLTKERNTTRDNLRATETALNAAQIQASATPTEVIVVKNIPMSFNELSLGEILTAAFAKLFKIK